MPDDLSKIEKRLVERLKEKTNLPPEQRRLLETLKQGKPEFPVITVLLCLMGALVGLVILLIGLSM